MKHFSLLLIILAAFIITNAQTTLYMPRDIKQAYAKGTRSMDGKPGKNYWQNHGSYNITVTAMPPDRNIKGKENITYFNNSTDTLRNPSLKLFLNIHNRVLQETRQPRRIILHPAYTLMSIW